MSRKAHKWRADNWPSQSPDLNPIENIWTVLKTNVGNHKPISVKELIKVIKKEWKALDPIYAENLVTSMKNHVSLLLSNGGDHILY